MAFISAADEITKKSLTLIENKFITKYLPILDDKAVKVYLYALYVFQNGFESFEIADFAAKLNMTEDQAKSYFEHLDEFELIKITSREPFKVLILDCENVSGTPKKLKPEKYADFAAEVQAIITGRMISTNEFLEYYYLLEEYGFERNALLMIINYCVNLKGDDIRVQYIKKVAKNFAAEGITTAKRAEEKLSSYTAATPRLIKIFSACSINRQLDVEDDRLLLEWTDEFGFTDDAIICASKCFKAKTTEKLDAALTELYKNKKLDAKEIEDYCKNKNSVYTATAEIAKELGVYMQNSLPYVENYVSVWINYGFQPQTLITLAKFCFMHGKNTFDNMNDFVLSLYDEGIVTTESVLQKLSSLDAQDKLIKNILGACGLTRKVIPTDRESLKRWKSWNFSNEMLYKAAEQSQGKSNPIAYMNAVLSAWKNDGIFSPENLENNSYNKVDTTESKKAIIERHYYDLRADAQLKADAALKAATADAQYADIKKKLNTLSVQLAFAEVRDKEKAVKLSQEIQKLEKAGDDRLAILKIDKRQFEPQYACKICNDTGYDSHGKQCVCLKQFIKDNRL